MKFEEFWDALVDKAYSEDVSLSEHEEAFYNLTCIRGETVVDGIEAYFESRFELYESDMQLLDAHGFTSLANDFRQARAIMFADEELNEELVADIIDKLADEDYFVQHMQKQLEEIYENIISKIDEFDDYRIEYGLQHGLFDEDDEI